MKPSVEAFEMFLRMNGRRVTPERLAIAEQVFKTHSHFHVDDLVDQVKREHPAISRATTYRTVNLLVKGGLLRKALFHDGRQYYEHILKRPPHGHFVCVNCGKYEDFNDGIIDQLEQKVCRKHGFEPIEYRLDIRGWCAECQEKKS